MNDRPRVTISWVDDDAHAIDPVVWPLRREGYEVRTYLSIAEALEHEEELMASDLMIVDIILPPGRTGFNDGLDLVQEMRKKGFARPIIVLSVVSAGRMGGGSEKISRVGVPEENVLRKPAPASELLACVQRALKADTPDSP